MLSLSALESTAVALLAALLLISTAAGAGRASSDNAKRIAAETLALTLAREIDAFHLSSCPRGAPCSTSILAGCGATQITFSGNALTVARGGFTATSQTLAPLSEASIQTTHSGDCFQIGLEWET